MAATLPTQAQGPGPTAQALPSWLSYSPVSTAVSSYSRDVTRILYYPDGSAPPFQSVEVQVGVTTSVRYAVVQRPILYTGPLPAPPLGTLYTTGGQTAFPTVDGTQPPFPTDGVAASSSRLSAAQPTAASSSQQQSAQPSSPASSAAAASASSAAASASSASSAASAASAASQSAAASASSASAASASASAAASSASSAASASASRSSAAAASSSRAAAAPSGSQVPGSGGGSARANAAGLSGGEIAGIVLSAFGALLLLLLLLLWRRRARRAGGAGAAVAHLHGRQGSEKYAAGFDRAGGRLGTYAAIGGGAGTAAGAAAGGRPRSVGSDEWEEDQLRNGSGFFVVGGKRGEGERPPSNLSTDTNAQYAGGGRGRGGRSAFSALGLGAAGGMVAAAIGRRTSGHKPLGQTDADEHDQTQDAGLSDDDEASDDARGESRGLMDFAEGEGGEMDMAQAGPSGWGSIGRGSRLDWGLAGGAAAAGAGAGAYAATRGGKPAAADDDDDDLSNVALAGQDMGSPSATRMQQGMTPSTSAASSLGGAVAWSGPAAAAAAAGASGYAAGSHAGSGSGSGSGARSGVESHSGSGSGGNTSSGSRGQGTSSASTGGRTALEQRASPALGHGSPSLLPPPRAPRASRGAVVEYGNVAPSSQQGHPRIPSFAGGFGEGGLGIDAADARHSTASSSSDASGLGVFGAAAAGAGLGAMAAGHRDSGGSTYSRGAYPDGEGDGEALPRRDGNEGADPRHSRFISSGTHLLGPGALAADPFASQHDAAAAREAQQASASLQPGAPGVGFAAPGNRLSTIRSVGEFGEQSERGSAIGSTGSGQFPSLSTASGSGSARSGNRPPTAQSAYATPLSAAVEEPPSSAYFDAQPASGASSSAAARAFSEPHESGGIAAVAPIAGAAPAHTAAPTGWTRTIAEDNETGPFSDRKAAQPHELADIPAESSSMGHHHHADATGAAAAAGLFGGLASGWKRLTSGQALESPSSTADAQIGEDYVAPLTHSARREPAQTSDPGLAADVQSLHASVHQSGHAQPRSGQHSSREASGNSGDVSGSGHSSRSRQQLGAVGAVAGSQHTSGSLHSSERSGGTTDGYSASLSGASGNTSSRGGRYGPMGSRRSNVTTSTGIDSLSHRTHVSSSDPDSSRSGTHSGGSSSRAGGASEGGASSGAASYSPSYLARGSTVSTRGGASSSGAAQRATSAPPTAAATDIYEDSPTLGTEEEPWASDGQSSRATAGNESSLGGGARSGGAKRPRSESYDGFAATAAGPSRPLDAVAEHAGPYEDLYGHYPSASLGAAAMRQAYREAGQTPPTSQAALAHSPSSDIGRTPRALPRSLLPGSAAAAPAAPGLTASSSLPPSLSAATSGSTWRESPRVASASMRASEAAAHLEASRSGGVFAGAPAELGAQPQQGQVTSSPLATSSPRRSRLRDAEQGPESDEANIDDPSDDGRRGNWPRFLRF